MPGTKPGHDETRVTGHGAVSLEAAAIIGRADTRHYARRRFTWFRHQLPDFQWVKPEEARELLRTAFPGA